MSSIIRPVPSPQTHDEVLRRGVTFLTALGSVPAIRAQLEGVGYTSDDHQEGLRLLADAVAGDALAVRVVPTVNDAKNAIAELESIEAPFYTRWRAALRRRFPEQEMFLFDGLAAGRGPEAVTSAMKFIERYHALKNAPDRSSTRKIDRAALALVQKRGLDDAMVKRMERLIETASTYDDVPAVAPAPTADIVKRRSAVLALHAWLQEWSETARTVITKRDQLIRLGLAKRRRKATQDTPAVPATPAPKPPVAPAVPATPIEPIESAPESKAA